MRRHRDPVPGRAVQGRGPGPAGVPGKVTRVVNAPTAPLTPAMRARLEASLATDLSAVRVGEDPGVAAIGARAHASGTEVLFAPGAYQPETADGQALIAHEVVHLVQQAERRVEPDATVAGTPVNTDRGLEQEADQLGAQALRGEQVRVSGPSLQPSTGTIQGFFGDLDELADLFDPLVDVASEWWDDLTDDSPGGGGGGSKIKVGEVVTVTDSDARVRDPAAGWAATGAVIPPGTSVTVIAIDGKYVQVTGVDGTEWGWTKKTNFGGSKGKGKGPDPAGPEEPIKPPPVLPSSDDEWQDLITESRDNVTVTENYSVATRALNPALLVAIRYSHLDKLGDFYDVLTQKSEKTKGKTGDELTPGRLAFRLGTELVEEAEATAARPTLLATKLALIDKVSPDGTIDIKKSAGGNLRIALGKDLSKSAQATVNDFIKARYQGGRLILTAIEVTELRDVVMAAVSATTSDPDRTARIAQLRADIVACETRVRAVLRSRATGTANKKKQALWTQLADLAETDGVFVDRMLTSYSMEHEDGSVTNLAPALAISVNYLNPGGFKNGGGKYSDKTIDSVLDDVYAGDPEATAKSDATKKFIHTLNRNEGGPASMNTWDGEIVTGGPGLSGSGRLQRSMADYKEHDPGGFHDTLGKFGVDIKSQRESSKSPGKMVTTNPYFLVRVPAELDKIPPALRGTVTPGEVIVGSSSTGSPKGGGSYVECAALKYISQDPVLMSRFMFAGQHSYQLFLIKEAANSMKSASAFSFLVQDGTPGGMRVNWDDLIAPLGADWLAATQAVIAYRYHASGKIGESLKVKAAAFYASSIGTDRTPEELTDDERKSIGRFVAGQLKSGKYKIYRKEFPSVASEVFPAAKDDKKDKGKGKGKAEDVDKDDDADVIILDDQDEDAGHDDTDDE
jgi:hypothetical protein